LGIATIGAQEQMIVRLKNGEELSFVLNDITGLHVGGGIVGVSDRLAHGPLKAGVVYSQNLGRLRITAPAATTVQVRLYSLSGRLLYTRRSEVTPGVHTVALDEPRAVRASGCYLLKCSIGEKTFTLRAPALH
jgi:hypothetical protein